MGYYREKKNHDRYVGYVSLMSHINDSNTSSYEEDAEKKVWKDEMTEEYQSILNNDVWEVVPRPKRKPIVTSKWIYKIKLVADGSVDKYKYRFVS